MLDSFSDSFAPFSRSLPLPPFVASEDSARGPRPAPRLEPARERRVPEDELAQLAASVGPLRRVLAAIAARLVDTKGWQRLCYARLSDYARERPGLSARQLQELARVHRALAALPALEQALVANALPWSKVRLVARVAKPEDLAEWIARARTLPVRLLEREVRQAHAAGAGGIVDPDTAADTDDGEPTTRVRLRCTPAVREKWSLVHELAERVAGQRLRAEDALELVVAEACSALPAGGGPRSNFGSCAEAVSPPVPGALRGVVSDPRLERFEGTAPSTRARPAELPPHIAALTTALESADAFELDRRLRLAVHLEQTLDAAIAPWLRMVGSPEYEWREAWCAVSTYARDHLGMSAGKARSLVRLERAAEVCPELRSAWREGRLSWVKARILLPLLLLDLEGEWRPRWVAWAERITVRRLERDVERALRLRAGHRSAWLRCESDPARAQDPIPPAERQLCAHDVDVDATEELAFRLPREVAVLLGLLLRRLSFEALLEHALGTWLLRDPGARRVDPVIERDGYRCAVPGCTSRRNLHDHHIAFRSAGGSDAPENRITLCAFHHQRCLHAGFLRIRGLAPDELIFELALRPDAMPLARYRSGDIVLATHPDPEPVERTPRAA
jgi:hypothetical protein